jgi:hypothetical protein
MFKRFVTKGGEEMNNEPVAWMSNGEEFYVQKNYCPDFIPLYTHPVKELTDKEIMLVSDEFKGIPVTSVDAWNKVILLFGKAILRKAQEK